MSEALDQKLSALKLARIRQVYPSWIEQAERLELGYGEVLEQLATEELLSRQENHLRRHMKAAGFPYAATIEQFDFSLRPELKRAILMRFFDSSFLTTAGSHLLILDEFGYLTLDPKVGPVLYEIIAGRYEKGAIVITSNKSLSTWGDLVGDSALMMAIIDRLLHHGEVFYLRGSSYRMRGKEPVALTSSKSEGSASSEQV